MKRILLVLLLLYASGAVPLYSQRGTFLSFGAGYNAAVMRSNGLDYVIKRYNSTKPGIEVPLPYCRFYDGFSFYAAAGIKRIYFDAGFVTRSCKVKSLESKSSGSIFDNGYYSRELKNKFNTINIGVGWAAVVQPRFTLALGLGTAIGFDKVLTRFGTNEPFTGKAGYGKPVSQFKAAFEPFLTIIRTSRRGSGLMIKPYASWSPVQTDYRKLNLKINPDGYKYDAPASVQSRLMGFGATLTFNIYQTLYPDPKPEKPENAPDNVFK